MSGAATTAAVAAAVAAEQRRQEEEEMTRYTGQELDGWEFKILRSARGVFGKPERLASVLEEEARAGWQLLEKFDDRRIRLKRPVEARSRDVGIDFDPYRTHVGPSETTQTIVVAAVVLAAMALVVLAILLLAGD